MNAQAVKRFDWRLAPGEEVRHELWVTYQPGAVRLFLKKREV
jgi:hypothetical protein